MDNEELCEMLRACCDKLLNPDLEVDVLTECFICKVADVILNGADSEETFHVEYNHE